MVGGSGGCGSLLIGMRMDPGIGIGQEWGDRYSKEFMGSNDSNYHASQTCEEWIYKFAVYRM
jgi:hypothetical protein